MKYQLKALLAAAAVLFIFFLATCDLGDPGVSITDRINRFTNDVENERNDRLTRHVHPNVANRDQMNEVYWDAPFPSGSYLFGPIQGGGNARTVHVAAGPVEWSDGDRWLEFEMREDGADWFIWVLEIWDPVDGLVNIIVPKPNP